VSSKGGGGGNGGGGGMVFCTVMMYVAVWSASCVRAPSGGAAVSVLRDDGVNASTVVPVSAVGDSQRNRRRGCGAARPPSRNAEFRGFF
jgi:hypothetical protein